LLSGTLLSHAADTVHIIADRGYGSRPSPGRRRCLLRSLSFICPVIFPRFGSQLS
jgi:hypothetical protein